MSLTQEQQEAIRCNSPNIMVIAAAGSGKTRVLVERINYIKKDQKVLAITFSRKATMEMQQRLTKLNCGHHEVTTFHRWCWKYVLSNQDLLEIPTGSKLSILDEQAQKNLGLGRKKIQKAPVLENTNEKDEV